MELTNCGHCGKEFIVSLTTEEMDARVLKFGGYGGEQFADGKPQCKECNAKFNAEKENKERPKAIRQLTKLVKPIVTYQCPVCEFTANSKAEVLTHLNRHDLYQLNREVDSRKRHGDL